MQLGISVAMPLTMRNSGSDVLAAKEMALSTVSGVNCCGKRSEQSNHTVESLHPPQQSSSSLINKAAHNKPARGPHAMTGDSAAALSAAPKHLGQKSTWSSSMGAALMITKWGLSPWSDKTGT